MKNVTITLPDELAHRAKIFAAEHNTSVSRYLGELLAERLEQERGYKNAMKEWCSVEPIVLNEEGSPYPSRDSLHER